MSRIVMCLEYPDNLAVSMFRADYEPPQKTLMKLPEDYKARINSCFFVLTKREQECVDYRFKQKMTLRDIGEKLNICRERVRQLEAISLRKLKRQWHTNYVIRSDVLNRYAEPGLSRYDTPIEDVFGDDLIKNVRLWNLLRRAGLNTINDILRVSPKDFMSIRGMGKTLYKTIVDMLKNEGIEIEYESHWIWSDNVKPEAKNESNT